MRNNGSRICSGSRSVIQPYKAILLLLADGAALGLPLADKVFSFVVGPKWIRQTIGLKSEAPKGKSL
jgi:hypothetical protein